MRSHHFINSIKLSNNLKYYQQIAAGRAYGNALFPLEPSIPSQVPHQCRLRTANVGVHMGDFCTLWFLVQELDQIRTERQSWLVTNFGMCQVFFTGEFFASIGKPSLQTDQGRLRWKADQLRLETGPQATLPNTSSHVSQQIEDAGSSRPLVWHVSA